MLCLCTTYLISATCAPRAARADILHLNDGTRHYGQLISQDTRTITFKITLAAGHGYAVKNFPAHRVARVEKGPPFAPPGQSSANDHRWADRADEDFEQMLREAFELIDDQDFAAARRALQRAVVRAPKQVLPALDLQTQATRGVSLPALLAYTRIRAALVEGEGRSLRFRYATPYERQELSNIADQLANRLLDHPFDGRPLRAWLQSEDNYDQLRPHTRHMVAAGRVAAGLLSIRLKYDEQLREVPTQRNALRDLRTKLSGFLVRVSDVPGFTPVPLDGTEFDPITLPVSLLDQIMPRKSTTTKPHDAETP